MVMNNHDFFFEGLGPSKTKEILLQENVPFSFIVRKIGREHVVSFLDAYRGRIQPTRELEHELLKFAFCEFQVFGTL